MKAPPLDRPREKLLRFGASALGDNELLALVLGRQNIDLANTILRAVGGLRGLARTSAADLMQMRGIGPAKAAQIRAATLLGRRTLAQPHDERIRFRSPDAAARYLIPLFGAHDVEQFGVMLLDTKHRLLRVRIIASGSLNSTAVHPREVFREAVVAQAYAVLLFHNHPSGDPEPSPDDWLLTRRLEESGEVLGIPIVDHIIVADTRYFSFRQASKLLREHSDRFGETGAGEIGE
jgi:DNA repair protein RadC